MDHKTSPSLPRWHIPILLLLLLLIGYAIARSAPALLPAQLVGHATSTGSAVPSAPPSASPQPTVMAAAQESPTAVAVPAPTETATATAAPAAPSPTAAGPTPTPTLMPLEARRELFNEVWETVDRNYLYVDFLGVDWDALRTTYEPRALAAVSAQEFYDILGEMVGRLGDEHSRYLPPMKAAEEDALTRGTDGYVGIGILSEHTADSILIHYVFAGSPAEEAGLKRRDRIIAVDGQPYSPALDVRGADGTSVRLTVLSPQQQPRDVEVMRRSITTKFTAAAGRLPGEPSIGYLFVPSLWADDMGAQVERQLSALLEQGPLSGLVLDLRGNGGGWRPVLEEIAGQFTTGEIGRFYTQARSYPLEVTPGLHVESLAHLPIAVLIDGGTESYAEVLAGVLQVQRQALVVGVASAGNTETIYGYTFDDGSRLWVAQEGFLLTNGVDLEGRGVIPDVRVEEDWTRYPEEQDPNLLAALEFIRQAAGRR